MRGDLGGFAPIALPGTWIMTDTSAANNNAVPAAENAGEASEPALDAMALAKEAAELRDRVLRALAEMENLRRRTDREVAEARTYGISSFARDLVGVADNIRRALDAAGDTAGAASKALVDGVELTERELLKVLEKHGVKKFEPQPREKFDPNLHQAMYEVQDPALPAGTVAQVVQAGYMIGDRMLRPALVAVARGGLKAAPDPTAHDNADAGPPGPEEV